jgi:hypothetical protein
VKKDWHTYAILALAAISWWYFQTATRDTKENDVAQWREWNKSKECLMTEVSHLKERVSWLEGYHKHEAECPKK